MSFSLPLALGLDLSTQQLKIIAVSVKSLETIYEKSLTFDIDLAHYKTSKGVYTNDVEHKVYSSVGMWIEAVDVILQKMKDDEFPFKDVVVISGAGQVRSHLLSGLLIM
jgi:xylulokinase